MFKKFSSAEWGSATFHGALPVATKAKPIVRPRPTVARFLLDGPVLPLVTETLRVAEAFRDAGMSQFRRWCRRNPDLAEPFRRIDQPGQFSSGMLSGKESNG